MFGDGQNTGNIRQHTKVVDRRLIHGPPTHYGDGRVCEWWSGPIEGYVPPPGAWRVSGQPLADVCARVTNAFGDHALLAFDCRAAAAAGETGAAALEQGAFDAINQHGFAVLEHAVSATDCDLVVAEMRPFINATPHGLHGLGGARRTGALVARSPASHKLIAHPTVLRLAERILGEQRLRGDAVRINGKCGKGAKGFRYPWQLHLTQIIDIGPGGGTDAMPHGLRMHRANGMWLHDFQTTSIDPQLEVMWALTDFTAQNGATHVVLGSHRETPRGGTASHREPTVQAAMPKGSALIWRCKTNQAPRPVQSRPPASTRNWR